MEAHRKLSIGTTLALFFVALVLAVLVRRSELAPSAAAELRAGAAWLDELAGPGASTAFAPESAAAVAAGYLERGRLGMGSPFRLIDLATHDPRLAPDLRRRVAWALLAQASRGEGYQVDPIALSGVSGPDGAAQRTLIQRTVSDASAPAVGALAVRLGYQLAALENTVPRGVRDAATDAAVLEADRVDAMRDAQHAFATASRDGDDVLETVSMMRLQRAFAVERPSIGDVAPSARTEVVRRAEAVVAALRTLAQNPGDTATAVTPQPLLAGDLAARLARLGTALPPVSAIGVAMRMLPSVLPDRDLDVAAPALATSPNEETFAAALSLTSGHVTPSEQARLGRLALRAAVHLRSLAQEQPWLPGMPSPAASEVTADLGLAGIRFDERIPQGWRGYYLRMLATSAADLQRVLPGLSLRGLTVSFTRDELPDSALAMHDPRSRTLRFSVALSAGTLAHELAHDLDWQTGRRLFPQAGGYGTDHAAQGTDGPLARSLRGIAAARIADPETPVSKRPVEQFARDVDWLVSSALAAEGRSDGYLSAAQDALVTGYASAAAGDFTDDGAPNVVQAVEEMTSVNSDARDAVLGGWSTPAGARLLLATQRAALIPMPHWNATAAGRLWQGGDRQPYRVEVPLPRCDSRQAGDPEARLLMLAVDARALGIARNWASRYDEDSRPEWARSVLGEAPFAPDAGAALVERVRNRLVAGWAPELGPLAAPFATDGLAACAG